MLAIAVDGKAVGSIGLTLHSDVERISAEPLPRDIIKKPELDIYIRDFGKKRGDFCIFAELNGKTVGGAWVRILDGEIKGYKWN